MSHDKAAKMADHKPSETKVPVNRGNKPNDKKNDSKDEKVKGKHEAPKVLKAEWTLERCKRYARRFNSEVEWASGASASYKSAVAHGWVRECLGEMGKGNQQNNNNRNGGGFKRAA